ncbi:hypothetical protein Misp02_34830 [Microtetraspora sp. NBRC 16547]|nr:hypothetical protein Misp02_34830 [Microtetraspora sp. NBRC 16547]
MPAELSAPFVLKAVSATLIHKSDAGGVRVGLQRDELPGAATSMREGLARAGHALDGFLVEELAPAGVEVVVGAVRTAGVGWVVMVGLGGVFVEILQDVAFGVTPLSPAQIRDMLAELRGLPVLQGARGKAPADLDALVGLIARLTGSGGVLDAMPADITEIDLNPVIVSPSGAVAVDARFIVQKDNDASEPVPHGDPVPAREMPFEHLFSPQTIAVLGASGQGTNGGNLFIRNLIDYGFAGTIVPIHPSAESIEGIPAVVSLGEIDGVVDYAYVALPAAKVATALAAGAGRVRFAQVVSSGFAETAEGVDLQRALVDTMRSVGTRIIGPNCLGTHSSSGRLTFVPEAPSEQGRVAVISQSGGLSVDILRLGESRGLAFHSVTSIGNGSDVKAVELLEYLLDTPETTVVGLYLESLAAARDVLDLLVHRECSKPIVLLAGGRTADGSRAAMSHTGALSGNHRLWPALARQAGVELVDSLDEFINVLLAMDIADRSIATESFDAVLFGNGGGASVLAADALERNGLNTPTLPEPAIERLNGLGLPPGNGLLNPIDVPAGSLAVNRGGIAEDILRTILEFSSPAIVISHFNVGIIQRNLAETHGDVTGTLIEAIARARDSAARPCHHFLVLKTDGKPDTESQIRGYAKRALALRMPVFPELEDAATAARALLRHQAKVASRMSRSPQRSFEHA